MKKPFCNIPCKCGHLKSFHNGLHKRNLGICMAHDDNFYNDNCEKYVPDNLKYLEMKYEEKTFL